MSAVSDELMYRDVPDVQLVGAFFGLALAESDRDTGLPFAMGTPSGRAKMRWAFTEIAHRWLPEGLLEEAAEWMDDPDA